MYFYVQNYLKFVINTYIIDSVSKVYKCFIDSFLNCLNKLKLKNNSRLFLL